MFSEKFTDYKKIGTFRNKNECPYTNVISSYSALLSNE